MSDLDRLLARASSLSVASSPPRTPPPLSSALSPLSATRLGGLAGAGQGGGGGGGRFGRQMMSLKSYSVIRISSSGSSVCFGCIGVGNAAFCIRSNCKIKAHVDTKVQVFEAGEEGRVFIVRSLGSTAFMEPSMSAAKVPPEVLASWMTQQCTLAEWNREFCAVEIANDVTASLEEIKEETSFLIKARDFRTPSKRNRDYPSVSTELHTLMGDGSGGQFVTHTRLLPVDESMEEDDDDLRQSVYVGGEGENIALTKVVSKVETSVVLLGEAIGVLSEQTHNRFVAADHEAKLVAGAVHTLSSNVGAAVELDERFEAPTLWGTAAFISDEVLRLNQEVLSLELGLKPIQVEMEWVRSSIQGFQGHEESSDKMLKILRFVMERIETVQQAVGPKLDAFRHRLDGVERKQDELAINHERAKRLKVETDDGAMNAQKMSAGSTMDDILRMMDGSPSASAAVAEGSPYPSRKQRVGNTLELGLGQSSNTIGFEEHARAVMAQLVSDVSMLKACSVTDKGVSFGGLGLRSIQECQVWIEENFSCYRYGLIMDPLLMLDRVFGNDGSDSKTNQLKVWEARIKLKISTGAEQSALQAISFRRPQLFHSGKAAMVSERNKSKLNQLPNFAMWKSGGEGVRNYIVNQMNTIYSSMTDEIAFALGCDARFMKANALALRSLNDTITFLTQLMNYIDVIYERLVNLSKFTPEQSWSLTSQILDRICEELYAPKEGIGGVMSIEDPRSVCSHMLWACFKTHDIMASYVDKNFENHPVVSAEYVKFLATNSGFEKVEKLEAQWLGMSDKLSKALDESKKAVAKSDVASTKCAELTRELMALSKKVKSLEERK